MWIKDNFLKNVDDVREIALNSTYRTKDHNSFYRGFRADAPDEYYHTIASDILEVLKLDRARVEMYFAYQTGDTTTTDEYSRHTDQSDWAGVIYLTPKPKPHSGTILYNKENMQTNIENRYNRLVAYNSKITHSPGYTFGDDINNARMTLTFFVYEER